MISGFDAYRIYESLKLHFFSKKYDAWEYKFETKVNTVSFEKRKEKSAFYVVGKKVDNIPELINYYTSFFVEKGKKVFIFDMLRDNTIYEKKKTEWKNINNIFIKDLDILKKENSGVPYYDSIDGRKPYVFDAYIEGKITLETLSLLDLLNSNKLTQEKWSNIQDTYLQSRLLFIYKYGVFLNDNNIINDTIDEIWEKGKIQ